MLLICIHDIKCVLLEFSNASVVYKEECQVWINETRRVENERQLQVACKVNKDCTGFDCAGNYIYGVRTT